MNYLKYIAKTGRINQHPQGKFGSHFLIKKITEISIEKKNILEIGCGTGHTAAILSDFLSVNYEGIDNMPEMIEFCNKRKKVLKLNNYNFIHCNSNSYPYENNSFDVIYCESALAIQDSNSFNQILNEVSRLLKPNGVFAFNETIWNAQTTTNTKLKVNNKVFKEYGIIQAEESAILENWKTYFTNKRLIIKSVDKINNLDKIVIPIIQKKNEINSINYSKKIKHFGFLNLKNIYQFLFFKYKNKRIKIKPGLLDSYIVILQKH